MHAIRQAGRVIPAILFPTIKRALGLLLMLLLSSCVRFLADDFGTTTDDDEPE